MQRRTITLKSSEEVLPSKSSLGPPKSFSRDSTSVISFKQALLVDPPATISQPLPLLPLPPPPPLPSINTYVDAVKQKPMDNNEFFISSEDFPALPTSKKSDHKIKVCTKSARAKKIEADRELLAAIVSRKLKKKIEIVEDELDVEEEPSTDDSVESSITTDEKDVTSIENLTADENESKKIIDKAFTIDLVDLSNCGLDLDKSINKPKYEKALPNGGIRTSADGKVSNIPSNMLKNQYGIAGLVSTIRENEKNSNMATWAFGQDLRELGLDMTFQHPLHPFFVGPFDDYPIRPQDVPHPVPLEYMVNRCIRHKLSLPTTKTMSVDLLFYFFYTNIGDLMQNQVAAELYLRGWRFFIEDKVWINHILDNDDYKINGTIESGRFRYFDMQRWKIMEKQFDIDLTKLEKTPSKIELVSKYGHLMYMS